MEYLAKNQFSFLQDRSFTSKNINVYTSIWNILQKSRFPFCKMLHLLVIFIYIPVNKKYLAKKPFSFLQNRSFTSNITTYTSKWNILQKKSISFL